LTGRLAQPGPLSFMTQIGLSRLPDKRWQLLISQYPACTNRAAEPVEASARTLDRYLYSMPF
jgi:hypothetical protein